MTQHISGGLASAVLAVSALALSLTGTGAAASPTATSLPTALATESPDISVADTMTRLQQLQTIATANGGNRGTGKPGYQASINYVKAELDAAGYTTTVQSFSTIYGTSYNLIADLPGGDTSNIVMAGGHLDSVRTGPGINDNGSGSAGLLETAVTLAESDTPPTKHVRFAFWGAEEQGLLGSTYYVDHLSAADLGAIDLYLNFDMIGSKNYGVFVYNDNAAGNAVRDELTSYFDAEGTPWEYIDVQGRSDHASFRAEGIPTAGLFSGAEGKKTAAQAAKWGGTAGQAFDACYHAACDSITNLSQASLDLNLDAIGHIIWQQAGVGGDVTPPDPPSGNLLKNAGFESGAVDWTGTTGAMTNNTGRPARTGSWKAWLGGNGTTSTETINQQVAIPNTTGPATLSFYVRIDTSESGSTVYDRLRAQIVSGSITTTLATYSNANANSAYVLKTLDVSAFKGKTVTVRFTATEDYSLQTSFVVDDTSLTVG